ncbi:MAG: redoxin family protein [Verrucomicrobiaceae bacterium]|nr:redoxin family protein [Verrucomicrobiaceae bacterium]
MRLSLRTLLPLAAILLSASFAIAQTPEGTDKPAAEAVNAAKEALQKLFAPSNSAEQLAELAKEANKLGVPRQQIIEARLVWGLRNQDTAFLTKLLPEVEVLAANFDPAQAAAMPNAEAVQSFAAYIRALKAQEGNDAEGFKKHILEAIWLQPGQATVFIQTIEKTRREAKMAALTVDMKLPITDSMGEATTLGDVVAGKKAILIDFWASWCGPCMQLMPSLKKKGESLPAHGIVVAAMNKDDENALSIAERIRKEQDMKIPWLIEPPERPFTKLFEIDSIPRMLLISPEGKVLFNGHPEDPALWAALKKLDASIEEAH